MAIKALKSVYSYYFPEVREIVENETKSYPHELILRDAFPGLDDYHHRLVELFIEKSLKYQIGLNDFRYKYYSNGSSEAIFHLLVESLNAHKPIYTFKGEYEGYREYTKNLGGAVVELEDNEDIKKLPKGIFFISNPSARNGNLIENKKIEEICEMGHEVVLDLAYLGMTREYQIDTNHPNIVAVVASMSKPYGLFYARVGFCFSRKPMMTLYPNIWFKNIFSINCAVKVLEKLGFGTLREKYLPWQEKSNQILQTESRIKTTPSDILLLSVLPYDEKLVGNNIEVENFKRGNYLRFCLTPYFIEMEETLNS